MASVCCEIIKNSMVVTVHRSLANQIVGRLLGRRLAFCTLPSPTFKAYPRLTCNPNHRICLKCKGYCVYRVQSN